MLFNYNTYIYGDWAVDNSYLLPSLRILKDYVLHSTRFCHNHVADVAALLSNLSTIAF